MEKRRQQLKRIANSIPGMSRPISASASSAPAEPPKTPPQVPAIALIEATPRLGKVSPVKKPQDPSKLVVPQKVMKRRKKSAQRYHVRQDLKSLNDLFGRPGRLTLQVDMKARLTSGPRNGLDCVPVWLGPGDSLENYPQETMYPYRFWVSHFKGEIIYTVEITDALRGVVPDSGNDDIDSKRLPFVPGDPGGEAWMRASQMEKDRLEMFAQSVLRSTRGEKTWEQFLNDCREEKRVILETRGETEEFDIALSARTECSSLSSRRVDPGMHLFVTVSHGRGFISWTRTSSTCSSSTTHWLNQSVIMANKKSKTKAKAAARRRSAIQPMSKTSGVRRNPRRGCRSAAGATSGVQSSAVPSPAAEEPLQTPLTARNAAPPSPPRSGPILPELLPARIPPQSPPGIPARRGRVHFPPLQQPDIREASSDDPEAILQSPRPRWTRTIRPQTPLLPEDFRIFGASDEESDDSEDSSSHGRLPGGIGNTGLICGTCAGIDEGSDSSEEEIELGFDPPPGALVSGTCRSIIGWYGEGESSDDESGAEDESVGSSSIDGPTCGNCHAIVDEGLRDGANGFESGSDSGGRLCETCYEEQTEIDDNVESSEDGDIEIDPTVGAFICGTCHTIDEEGAFVDDANDSESGSDSGEFLCQTCLEERMDTDSEGSGEILCVESSDSDGADSVITPPDESSSDSDSSESGPDVDIRRPGVLRRLGELGSPPPLLTCRHVRYDLKIMDELFGRVPDFVVLEDQELGIPELPRIYRGQFCVAMWVRPGEDFWTLPTRIGMFPVRVWISRRPDDLHEQDAEWYHVEVTDRLRGGQGPQIESRYRRNDMVMDYRHPGALSWRDMPEEKEELLEQIWDSSEDSPWRRTALNWDAVVDDVRADHRVLRTHAA
ncbi:hypothetical protein BDZ85DRAFT_247827 [Elsinoe ampelina]|uniref:Uncharacterized protein n=1 Tax=Elsinoe ampelina TaxID=302913 RepID=A0A6A6GK18_9PEZI|nr:hypothetical protein BDZ85DRAFT_247827 [Elsinoe ampelina]